MANTARAAAESALRLRKLDRTLTDALPPLERSDPASLVPTDAAALDSCLHGGLPRGQLSELAGPASSGRTSLLLHLMAAATRRGEIVALVDTFDRLDVASAAAAGIDFDRFLWIRGDTVLGVPSPGGPARYRAAPDNPARRSDAPGEAARRGPDTTRQVERAVKALNLVLQAGGFAVVAIDLADASRAALNRLPFTTWRRVQRIIEGSDTACLVLAPEPLARSAGGLTLTLGATPMWSGDSDRSRHLAGNAMRVRVVSPRRRVDASVRLAATAT